MSKDEPTDKCVDTLLDGVRPDAAESDKRGKSRLNSTSKSRRLCYDRQQLAADHVTPSYHHGHNWNFADARLLLTVIIGLMLTLSRTDAIDLSIKVAHASGNGFFRLYDKWTEHTTVYVTSLRPVAVQLHLHSLITPIIFGHECIAAVHKFIVTNG
jgi:hypothetical protein